MDLKFSIRLVLKVFFLISLSGCTSEPKVGRALWDNDTIEDKYIANARALYPRLKTNWELNYFLGDSIFYEMSFLRHSGDTVYEFAFECGLDTMLRSIEYTIKDYYKVFKRDGYYYTTEFDNRDQVLWSFREADGAEEKDFILGKYEYLFQKRLLDASERTYYIEHRDSLKSIRGNDLPGLH